MRSIPFGEPDYGEIAALAGHPNAQRAVGSVCAANRFALFVPCHRVVAPTGSARTARSGRSTSDDCWSSKVSFSEDVRAELAGIAPTRECDRLAELSALFHFAGRLHLLGRGEVSLHLDLSSPSAARRAFALLRRSVSAPRSAPISGMPSGGRRGTSFTWKANAREVLERAGVVDARFPAAGPAAAQGCLALVLPARPTCAARSPPWAR